MPWEGVAAQRAGVDLNVFKLADYGIPYCYSPVLAAHPQTLAQNPDLVKSFLAATARGYEYAAEHPAEAAELLCSEVAADVAKVRTCYGSVCTLQTLHVRQLCSRAPLLPTESWELLLPVIVPSGAGVHGSSQSCTVPTPALYCCVQLCSASCCGCDA